VEDATGAGDTFLGGFLASQIKDGERPEDAVAAGACAAREMLAARELAGEAIRLKRG
jgi:sugar/nucleoside kinase (ribokinase family)